jgi:hypothetical protein
MSQGRPEQELEEGIYGYDQTDMELMAKGAFYGSCGDDAHDHGAGSVCIRTSARRNFD